MTSKKKPMLKVIFILLTIILGVGFSTSSIVKENQMNSLLYQLNSTEDVSVPNLANQRPINQRLVNQLNKKGG